MALRQRDRDKLRPHGPLSSYADFTYLPFNIAGEKGGKEGLKKDSRGDDDETASVTSYESSMASIQRKTLKTLATDCNSSPYS